MVQTYNFLKTTLTKKEKFKLMTDEELVKVYQQTQDGEILTYEFCKHIKLWMKISSKFMGLSYTEDIPSLILIALTRALTSFDFEKNIIFKTYAGTCIYRELENKLYPRERRKINTVSTDTKLSVGTENLTYADIISDEKDYFNLVDMKDFIEKSALTNNEIKVCKLLMSSNKGLKNKEIACELNVHRHTVAKIKDSLKNKLQNLKENYTPTL